MTIEDAAKLVGTMSAWNSALISAGDTYGMDSQQCQAALYHYKASVVAVVRAMAEDSRSDEDVYAMVCSFDEIICAEDMLQKIKMTMGASN